jgi:hypothetical protein
MSHSIAPTDTRSILVQQPQLSDDYEPAKNSTVPTPSNPVPRHNLGASGITQKKISK